MPKRLVSDVVTHPAEVSTHGPAGYICLLMKAIESDDIALPQTFLSQRSVSR